MSIPSGSSNPSSNLADINAALHTVTASAQPSPHKGTSKGRCYIALNDQKNHIGLTTDVKQASSIRDLSKFVESTIIHTYTEAVSTGNTRMVQDTKREIRLLRQNFEQTIENASQNEVPFYKKIIQFLSGSAKLEQQALTSARRTFDTILKHHVSDLDTLPEKETTFKEYQAEQKAREKAEDRQPIASFKQLAEMPIISKKNLVSSFASDLEAYFRPPTPGMPSKAFDNYEMLAMQFANRILLEELEKFEEEGTPLNESNLAALKDRIKERIVQERREEVPVDREIFADIHIKKGKPIYHFAALQGTPEDAENFEKLQDIAKTYYNLETAQTRLRDLSAIKENLLVKRENIQGTYDEIQSTKANIEKEIETLESEGKDVSQLNQERQTLIDRINHLNQTIMGIDTKLAAVERDEKELPGKIEQLKAKVEGNPWPLDEERAFAVQYASEAHARLAVDAVDMIFSNPDFVATLTKYTSQS